MAIFKRKTVSPPVNPALFLTQALRSLEEAKKFEDVGTEQDTVSAFRVYAGLVQTFQHVFSISGSGGQDRIRPLNNRHIIFQIIQVAEESAKGFDRTHIAIPLLTMMNLRSTYYAYPQYPAEVSSSVTWLRSKAQELPKESEAITSQGITKQNRLSKNAKPADTTEPNANPTPIVPTDATDETECSVCGDLFSEGAVKLPPRPPTRACSHPATVCTSCLSQTIAAHIDMRGTANPVPCPNAECSSVLSNDDVKQWASEDIYARWDMFSLREQMRKDTSGGGGLFVWCQSPDCYSGQLHPEGASQPIVTCIRCSSKTCFNHNVLYHEGQSCKQYDRSRPIMDGLNRSVSRVAIWWRTRNCPGCFQPIEKNGGCRHMRCRCGYSFTWWYAPVHWRRFTPFIKARSPGI